MVMNIKTGKRIVRPGSSPPISEQISNKIKSVAWPHVFSWKVKLSWKFKRMGRPHNLPAKLIISLTSYPKRFLTLPLTLKCLLSQTIKADRVILWIAHQDKDALTPDILDLETSGLEVQFCDDLKSYKKIIPTLKLEPDAFIVTADDDTYYPSSWLEELVIAYDANVKEVLCHRAYRVRLNDEGAPRRYIEWRFKDIGPESSPLNFPTGNGGIMYPPGIFHEDVLKSEIFDALCPHADDVWLYWMVRLKGGTYRKVGPDRYFFEWPDTQAEALWLRNMTATEGGNDERIRAMVEYYGFPR